jgi:hypothetical protein
MVLIQWYRTRVAISEVIYSSKHACWENNLELEISQDYAVQLSLPLQPPPRRIALQP